MGELLDEATTLNLGLQLGPNRRNKVIELPKREGTIRSLFPYSPLATWMVNKFIADYIGIVPAIVLCELITHNQGFNEENCMPKGSPFTLGNREMELMAKSIGINEELYKSIINTFKTHGFLVKTEIAKEPPRVRRDRVRRGQGLEYEWFYLDYELMDKLFFNA